MHGRQSHEVPAFLRRLDRQASATRSLRQTVYERSALPQAKTVLDVGCGSGAVTGELMQWGGRVVAVDVDGAMARQSRRVLPREVPVLHADGLRLPFADGTFDVAVCNLVLLWAPDPAGLVREMARVVRPGGQVIASMEPDYGGKVHWPASPLVDVVFQGEGVRRRGGDPWSGRKLRQHFVAAGLRCDVGIGNAEVPTPEQDLANFRRNRSYYRRLLSEAGFGTDAVDAWEEEYLQALEAGIQLCFLPVFHAIGTKPGPDDAARP